MTNPIIPAGDIFSKRQKRLRGDVPDVYVYDNMPDSLRQQICYILMDAFNNLLMYQPDKSSRCASHYGEIVKILRQEMGAEQIALYKSNTISARSILEFESFVKTHYDIEETVDAIEVALRYIHYISIQHYRTNSRLKHIEDEINYRFSEHGVGYRFTGGRPIRVDSELIHQEIVKPALTLLGQQGYEGAQEEFLEAHRHYREGDAKSALNECLKAFESTMKAICQKRGWPYDSNAPARDLIQKCFDEDLIPQFWQSHYASLRSLLESSVPTGRNRISGHGQGPTPRTVPGHLVAYMLHMTASAIVFLAEAEKSLDN